MRLFRSRTLRRIALFVLTLAVGYGAITALRGRDLTMPEFFRPPSKERILMTMEGFTVSQSERGTVVWRASARLADLLENKQARLEALDILYTDPVRGDIVLRGEQGTLDTVTGDAKIRSRLGDVRVLSSDGYLLTTQSLTWTSATRVMTTPDAFKLLGPKIYLEGRGITARVDQNTVVVEKDVKAVLQE